MKNERLTMLPIERARAALAELAPSLLQFLADEPGRLDRFLALTGLSAETLRAASRSPDFPAHLLDYVSSDEGMLLAYAAENDRAPADLA